jgi:ATP-dependent DNA helicase DinG
MIVIDEAHKFLQAARSMYGVEMSSSTIPDALKTSGRIRLRNDNARLSLDKMSMKLVYESKSLFRRLISRSYSVSDIVEDEVDRFVAVLDKANEKSLRNIRDLSNSIMELLDYEPVIGKSDGRKAQLVWELEQIRNQAATLSKHTKMICWLEKGNQEYKICAIPKDLDNLLYEDLWNKGIPTVLTSGTLSVKGDFSRIKSALGLNLVGSYRITETSKPSPFNFKDNSIMYIADDMPFPDQKNPEYIDALANRIKQLIIASHGHAAVLFTSYRVMNQVWNILERQGIPFPMFRLGRGNIREIERFKSSGNGVLFAAGALWEGIDIPGDSLSLLIIPKLPFPVPDPISKYERSLCKSDLEFKENFIIPETAIKYMQGLGRGLRIESDTCAFAVLDCRMFSNGFYRNPMLAVSPDCRTIHSVNELHDWYIEKKSAEYFIQVN